MCSGGTRKVEEPKDSGKGQAYAPMLAAASYHEKYLKVMAGRFGLEINVD